MKTKLLKRLRRRFVIHERNGRYLMFDRTCTYTHFSWTSLRRAREERREMILIEAQKYSRPKNRNVS